MRTRRAALAAVALAFIAVAPAGADDKKDGAAPTSTQPAVDPVKPETAAEKPPEETAAQVGKAAPDFTLHDSDGKEVRLSSFKGKIVVLQWINPGCSSCQRVSKAGLMQKMLTQLKDASSDIVYLPIDSCSEVDGKRDADYLAEHKIEQKPLLDPEGTTGHAYGAQTTPHLFVIDAKGVLRYSGALDDDPAGKNPEGAKNYVVEAVKQIVAGKPVAQETTKPYG